MIKHWTTASSLCWLTALACIANPLVSNGFTNYIYDYEATIITGTKELKFNAKAHLELLYHQDNGEGQLFRLHLTEPVFYHRQDDDQQHSSSSNDKPLSVIKLTNNNIINGHDSSSNYQYSPNHDLYAHIITLNGTAYVKEIYTHQSDSCTFKNIKKSLLLNLLPTKHHHHYNTPNNQQTITSNINNQQHHPPLFIDDNQIAQPELFSPDTLSQVSIISTKLDNNNNNINLNKQHMQILKQVQGYQNLTFGSRIFHEAQSNLTTNFKLNLIDQIDSDEHQKFDQVTNMRAAIELLPKYYKPDTIVLERERKVCHHHHCSKSLPQLFQDYEEFLADQSLASVEAAVAFLRLLERLRIARGSSVNEILQILKKTTRNQGIESSILDILAAARTKNTILAALKYIKLPKNRNLDVSERFLSVLSVAAKTTSKMQLKRPLKSPYYFDEAFALRRGPQLKEQESELASIEFIARELLRILKSTPSEKWLSHKLRWSCLLTLATLVNANVIDNNLNFDYSDRLNEEVSKLLINELELCHGDDTDCRIVVLQAIGNVGILIGEHQFKILKEHILHSGKRESIAAMKVLKDLLQNQPKDKPLKNFDPSQLKDLLMRVVYDSNTETTVRVLAAELIARFVPSEQACKQLLMALPSFNNSELATMIYNRMQSLKPDSLTDFKHNWVWEACIINGTSASFVKTMAKTDSLEARYGVNVELMNKVKVLKESSFDVFLDTDKRTQDLFSLGIFARGLSNLPGVDSSEEESESESTMSGMTLRLLGGYLRPYIFFEGTGALLSHIMSGTASEPTTAFNGDLLLIDHEEGYPLISGFISEHLMRGVLSIDVTGKVEASMWHRYSHSVVRTKAAVIVQASQSIFTGYDKLWRSQLFSFGGQALVDFVADLSFRASPPRICLQVTQPEFMIRVNKRSREQSMTDEVIRKITRKNYSVGAKSYSLNTENNKMCSLMEERDELR